MLEAFLLGCLLGWFRTHVAHSSTISYQSLLSYKACSVYFIVSGSGFDTK